MYIEPQLYRSFKHIEAKSPKELEKMMLMIQLKSGMPIKFTPPTYSEGKWHTWFNHNFEKEMDFKDKLKMSKV